MVERSAVNRVVAGSNPARRALRQAQCKSKFNMWYVYILFCDQKIFYTGITNNVQNRLALHKSKDSFFTKKFSDLELVYCEKYDSKQKAVKREKQIKGWSRAKKKMLINGKLGFNTCTQEVRLALGLPN